MTSLHRSDTHDIDSGHNHKIFPESVVRQGPLSDDGDDTTGSDEEQDIVAGDTFYGWDDDRSEFDILEEYIYDNSNAISALMHHDHLDMVREVGGTGSISSILARIKPHIMVDEDGVGEIYFGEIQNPGSTADPSPVAPSSQTNLEDLKPEVSLGTDSGPEDDFSIKLNDET